MFFFAGSASLYAQELRGADAEYGPFYPAVFEGDLRDLPVPPEWQFGDPISDVPRARHSLSPERTAEPAVERDPLLEIQASIGTQARMNPIELNLSGQVFAGIQPPDPVGDVGLDHYIQGVNGPGGTRYTVYNKSTGAIVAGPFVLSALGTGNCASGKGDPIVLYDIQAQRWLLSEFSTSGNKLCVYLSRTSNPVSGGWYNYSFTAVNFPDYPKYGIWHDAYYVTTNESTGPAIYAINRSAMLAGAAVSMQRFTPPPLAGFSIFQALTPADRDSELGPPVSAPFPLLRHRDDESHDLAPNPQADYLDLFLLDINWSNSTLSSLTGPFPIQIAEFDSDLCGLNSFLCFPQPGSTVRLDPVREIVMNRLAYMNFGTHQALVGNFVTDVDGTNHGGIRWFELRASNGGLWALQQEGTFAPDANHRWMGSLAMDRSGNIALGYSIVGQVAPSLRITGRHAYDPPGVMTQVEQTIAAGTAANGTNRFGDYAAMSLDPVNFCTFWFTGQYNTSSVWSTRIARFSFSNCGCELLPVLELEAEAVSPNLIELTWQAAGPSSLRYMLYRAEGGCENDFELLANDLSTTSFQDADVSGGSLYAYKVVAVDPLIECRSDFSACAEALATGFCRLPPLFSGISSVENAYELDCLLDLSWEPGLSQCGGPLVYNLYRDVTPDFVPSAQNLIASCLDSTQYRDQDVTSGTRYFYIARAEEPEGFGTGPCGKGFEEENLIRASALVEGATGIYFHDEFESGSDGWDFMAGPQDENTHPWSLSEAMAHSPTHCFFKDNGPLRADQSFGNSADLFIPRPPVLLRFRHYYELENGKDGAVLEFSTNQGADWVDILAGDGNLIPSNPDRFQQNGYNLFLKNPLSVFEERGVWSGLTSAWQNVVVDLADFAGVPTRFRWRLGSGQGGKALGWFVDDIAIFQPGRCLPGGCTDDLLERWAQDLDIIHLLICAEQKLP